MKRRDLLTGALAGSLLTACGGGEGGGGEAKAADGLHRQSGLLARLALRASGQHEPRPEGAPAGASAPGAGQPALSLIHI